MNSLRPRSLLGVCILSIACGEQGSGQAESGSTGPAATDDADDSGSSGPADSDDGEPAGPPDTPMLQSPADDAMDVSTETGLCWNAVDEFGSVRYRVFLDGIELTQGKLGDEGFEGTCTGPLSLEFDREYTWSVQAFRPADPTLQSDMSETWAFRTEWDGDSKVLFEDDFSEDRGWTFEDDAQGGAWVRGNPVPTVFEERSAQPGECAGGQDCMFTGQNVDAGVEDDDLDGGTVSMTSPEFDPTGSKSVTVSLARYFFRSSYGQTGASLRIELLVPDADAPDGYVAHVLEKLDNDEAAQSADLWTPVAFAACDVPYVPGTRLRISATNEPGLEEEAVAVVEAAIDNVVVTGQQVTDGCQTGEGSLCNPADPICDDGLLCCAQGVLNEGIYRCSQPVPGIDTSDPGEPMSPLTGPLGCDAPDLAIDTNQMEHFIDTVEVDPNTCTLLEKCVNGVGTRRILRFDMFTVNAGSRDLDLGVPSNHLDLYHFSECHEHYHFDGYARYALLDDQGDIVAPGHKQAFCLWDGGSWAWPNLRGWDTGEGEDTVYSCFNQGLQLGWYDEYYAELDCQWIDITDVPPGDYRLLVEVNLPREGMAVPALVERDYANNSAEINVTIPP